MYAADPTSTDDKKVVFTYDYMSRRVRKQSFFWSTDHWQLATDQLFVYDDWNVIMVLDGLDNNAVTRKYSWGLDHSGTFHDAGGIGGLLAVEETTGPHQGSYWFFYDANGNVGQLVKGSDAALPVAAQYEYDAYGNALVASGTYAAENPFRFSTKWLDSETGLYCYGHRYYSSWQGRWVNRDLIGERGGLNLFAFVRNRPSDYFDPVGLNRGYVCCTAFGHVFEVGGYASPGACAVAALQGTWYMNVLSALIADGIIILSDIGVAVRTGYAVPPFAVAALAALELSYVYALETCMDKVCVESHAATRTVTPNKYLCFDEVCYSCTTGAVVDPHDTWDDDEQPTATEKCHLLIND